MSTVAKAKDSTIFLPSNAADLVPSRFFVDVQVEASTSMLGKSKLAWRQCHVEGQRLQIVDNTTVVATMATPACTLREHKPANHTYKLQGDGKSAVVLYFPSATTRARLEQVLELSKQSPYWALPASNELNDRLAVAAAIVESEAVLKKPSARPADVTVAQVQAYLARVKPFYDQLKDCNPEQVYAAFLDMEETYVKDSSAADTLPAMVHKMNPRDYAKFTGKDFISSKSNVHYGRVKPLKHIFRKCPHPSCVHPWSMHESLQLHIYNQALVCSNCHSLVNYDMYKVAALVGDIPAFSLTSETWNGRHVQLEVQNPGIPTDGQMKTFITALSRAVKAQKNSVEFGVFRQLQNGIYPKLEKYLACDIGRYHVDLVRGMFRLWELLSQVGPELAYWTEPIVIQAAIVRYQKYMKLVQVTPSKYREVPTADIALVMQAHQQDHERYFNYWHKVTGDTLFMYSDHDENWDFAPSYAEMFIRWVDAYDEPYSSTPPSFDAWASTKASNAVNGAILKKKWAKYVRLPAHDSRFVGVSAPHSQVATATLVAPADGGMAGVDQSPEAVVCGGLVLGSPVATVIPSQQSTQLKKLLHEDGFLCSEVTMGGLPPSA